MIKDKRTKSQLLERIVYLEQRNNDIINQANATTESLKDLNSRLRTEKESKERIERELIRCNELVSATTQENNRLTIERNAANALVDRIRIPSEMNISARDMQTLLDKLNSEVVAALLLVKG